MKKLLSSPSFDRAAIREYTVNQVEGYRTALVNQIFEILVKSGETEESNEKDDKKRIYDALYPIDKSCIANGYASELREFKKDSNLYLNS